MHLHPRAPHPSYDSSCLATCPPEKEGGREGREGERERERGRGKEGGRGPSHQTTHHPGDALNGGSVGGRSACACACACERARGGSPSSSRSPCACARIVFRVCLWSAAPAPVLRGPQCPSLPAHDGLALCPPPGPHSPGPALHPFLQPTVREDACSHCVRGCRATGESPVERPALAPARAPPWRGVPPS